MAYKSETVFLAPLAFDTIGKLTNPLPTELKTKIKMARKIPECTYDPWNKLQYQIEGWWKVDVPDFTALSCIQGLVLGPEFMSRVSTYSPSHAMTSVTNFAMMISGDA